MTGRTVEDRLREEYFDLLPEIRRVAEQSGGGNNLAGVRVLAFPLMRRGEIDVALRAIFPKWTVDPVLGDEGETLAFKYWGYCQPSQKILGEYQIVSVLTGFSGKLNTPQYTNPRHH